MANKKPDFNKLALELHKKLKGKLELKSKGKLKTKTDWSTMFTPGVAAVSSYLYKNPSQVNQYTMKGNTVAIVSDGSAVLGLGNLGPVGVMPLLEGKAVVFKELAGINAVPLALDTQEPEEMIRVIKALAPNFSGISLEAISAPKCFEIEKRLTSELRIPIFHDDQHSTAIVVLAALINAAKVVKKNLVDLKIVVVGAGTAGRAIIWLLLKAGIKNLIVLDSKGAICKGRPGMADYKKELAEVTNLERRSGDLLQIIEGADVVIGVSGPGTIAQVHIEKMATQPIVFTLSNPIPEIMPADAKRAGAFIVATGLADFPNQINNALVFPGVFRGALDKGIGQITEEMKLAVAKKIAGLVKKPTNDSLVPTVLEPSLIKGVASAILK